MAESPLPRPLRFLAAPAAMVYARAMAHRNRAYDRGRGVVEIDRTVLSVGNLTLGGTGKTPMVKRLVRELLKAGRRPAIAMRGYASHRGYSDEAGEYEAEFPEVPVVAQANRLEGLLQLFATSNGKNIDTVVLDDGFQHRRIARQYDIVLVDASKQPLRDRIFPAGTLREPLESLARADAIVITHAESASSSDLETLRREISAISGGLPVAVSRHVWSGLRVIYGKQEHSEPTAWLRGKRVIGACAIGHPAAFLAGVRQAAGAGVEEFVLADHDPFSPGRVSTLIDLARRTSAAAIVMTSKDWSKLRRVDPERWPCPLVVAQLDLSLEREWEAILNAAIAARPEMDEVELRGAADTDS